MGARIGLFVLALASPVGAPTPPIDPAALVVPADAPELAANPALAGRLRAGPHAYFRGINARFMRLLCSRLDTSAGGGPVVTLHGDAHLEQYAVTDRGRGLTDFDDSTSGPALIDLARFATSIRLAMRERGWSGAEKALAAFLRGYTRALSDPRTVAPEPTVARRLRSGFDPDRRASLSRAESLMKELPPSRAPSQATLDKVALLLGTAARLPPSFFRVKKFGALTIGIGSAADEKYLFRIEGPSSAEGDDVILEVKEVRTLPALDCLHATLGPTRILVAQNILAYEPFSYLGALSLEGRHFWFHAWTDNYAELSIARSLESVDELVEVAYDSGVQLGRGHVKRDQSHVDKKLRRALRQSLSPAELEPLTEALADATEEAWRRFRDAKR